MDYLPAVKALGGPTYYILSLERIMYGVRTSPTEVNGLRAEGGMMSDVRSKMAERSLKAEGGRLMLTYHRGGDAPM